MASWLSLSLLDEQEEDDENNQNPSSPSVNDNNIYYLLSQSAGEPEKAKKANENTKKSEKQEKPQHKKPQNVKRVSSAGLQAKSLSKTKTGHLKEYFNLGRKLGHGQFGTTFLRVEKATGKAYACKSIAKRKLVIGDDVEDVRREIEILHHLSGDPNVVGISS